MRVILTKGALEWFEHHNISFNSNFQERLKPGQSIYFQDDAEVEPYVGFHAGAALCPMGTMSYTNSDLPTDATVGRYCSLAWGLGFPRVRHPIEHLSTSIFTHNPSTDLTVRFVRDHKPDYKKFFPNPQRGSISIGHDVWIGQNVSILPGVSIGTGAVIASGANVTKSVGPYEIVGGNPARPIKDKRFPEEIVTELLSSEWWAYKFTDFDGIDISKPEVFLKEFSKIKPQLTRYEPSKVKLRDVVEYCHS